MMDVFVLVLQVLDATVRIATPLLDRKSVV